MPNGDQAVFLGFAEGGISILRLKQQDEVRVRFGDCVFFTHVFPFKKERDTLLGMTSRLADRFDVEDDEEFRNMVHSQKRRAMEDKLPALLAFDVPSLEDESDDLPSLVDVADIEAPPRRSTRTRVQAKADGLYSASPVLKIDVQDSVRVLTVDFHSASKVPVPKSVKARDAHLFRDEWEAADEKEVAKLLGELDSRIKVIEKVKASSLSSSERRAAMRGVFVRKVKKGTQGEAVFKTRMTTNGSVEEDDPTISSSDRSSPAAGSAFLLWFISIVVTFSLLEDQLDFESAFGQAGPIPKERHRYVWPQKGSKDDLEGFIYRIIGNMYGRIDAPKRWYIRVAKFLFDKGFRRTRITETIFVMFTANCFIIVILHVDDLRAAFRPEDASVWYSFVEELAKEFKFVKKDLGEFIGFQFIRNADGSMDIHQESYVTSLLQEWGMLWGEYKAKAIPLNKGIVLDVVHTDDPKVDKTAFKSLLGEFAELCLGALVWIIWSKCD